jgi:hypothetical protein
MKLSRSESDISSYEAPLRGAPILGLREPHSPLSPVGFGWQGGTDDLEPLTPCSPLAVGHEGGTELPTAGDQSPGSPSLPRLVEDEPLPRFYSGAFEKASHVPSKPSSQSGVVAAANVNVFLSPDNGSAFEVLAGLGQGGYASVVRCVHLASTREFAMKVRKQA